MFNKLISLTEAIFNINQLILLSNKNYRKNYKREFKLEENNFTIKKDKRKSIFKLLLPLIGLFSFIIAFLIVSIFLNPLFLFFCLFFIVFSITYISYLILNIHFQRETFYCFTIIKNNEILKKQRKALTRCKNLEKYYDIDQTIICDFKLRGECHIMELYIEDIIDKLEKMIFNNELIEVFCSRVLIITEEYFKKLELKKEEENKKEIKNNTKKYVEQLLDGTKEIKREKFKSGNMNIYYITKKHYKKTKEEEEEEDENNVE